MVLVSPCEIFALLGYRLISQWSDTLQRFKKPTKGKAISLVILNYLFIFSDCGLEIFYITSFSNLLLQAIEDNLIL